MGQPTELALLEFAQKFGFGDDRGSLRRVSEIPFNSEQKWMSTQVDTNEGLLYFVKGAPEFILEKCVQFVSGSESGKITKLTSEVKESIIQSVRHLSMKGNRVLALSYGSNMEQLIFTGLVGIFDPPRPGVAQSISQLQKSGIKVIMITGDAKETAVNIADNLGIMSSHQNESFDYNNSGKGCVTGEDLDNLDKTQFLECVNNNSVFCRTTPKHKLQIVQALQNSGKIVAMTGDGVNDGPALKLADVGISMGQSGTDVSKEASDMILIDDNFGTILHAIEEGKSIFQNIKNFLTFQLSTSVAALSLIALSTIFGFKAPLNPMQILWINIIMDGPPAQSLGVEPADPEVLKSPPRNKSDAMIDRSLIRRVLTAALVIVIGTMFIFIYMMKDREVSAKDTTMTFTTFVFFDMFNAMSCRSQKKSLFELGLFTNKPLIISVSLSIFCQLVLIYVPLFQSIFLTEPLSILELACIITLTSSVWVVDELQKMRLYGKHLNLQRWI